MPAWEDTISHSFVETLCKQITCERKRVAIANQYFAEVVEEWHAVKSSPGPRCVARLTNCSNSGSRQPQPYICTLLLTIQEFNIMEHDLPALFFCVSIPNSNNTCDLYAVHKLQLYPSVRVNDLPCFALPYFLTEVMVEYPMPFDWQCDVQVYEAPQQRPK